jgi:predicted dehydrogenase
MTNWGIIGTGNGARDFTIGLKSLPNAKAVAVGSRTPARAQEFAQAMGISASHGTYEALVNDPEVQMVYIATPHHSHFADCMLALKAGKPVLCEKPFAMNADEARQIFKYAKENKLFCMEAMWMRFMPLVLQAKKWIDEDRIGQPLSVVADFGYVAPQAGDNRFFNPSFGGGALLDRGVYLLSLAQMILGKPHRIAANAKMSVSGVDAHSAYFLQYASGASAQLQASLIAQASNQAVIMGEKGTIIIHEPFYRPHKVSISLHPNPPMANATVRPLGFGEKVKQNTLVKQVFFRIGSGLKQVLRPPKNILQPWESNGYQYEAAEVMRCLALGLIESPMMPVQDSIEVLEVADEIRKIW